jgi:hypothetical protein
VTVPEPNRTSTPPTTTFGRILILHEKARGSTDEGGGDAALVLYSEMLYFDDA